MAAAVLPFYLLIFSFAGLGSILRIYADDEVARAFDPLRSAEEVLSQSGDPASLLPVVLYMSRRQLGMQRN